MKRLLLGMALAMAGIGLLAWVLAGGNLGWTKTSVVVKTLDEITGIEGLNYQKSFVPGVDFLVVTLAAAAGLAGVSFLFRSTKNQPKHMRSLTKISFLLAVPLAAGALIAEPAKFDFKDPKGVNNAVFELDAPLESITGSANGISGTVTFDSEKPAATTGRIVVEAKSLTVPNSMMKDHMHGVQWMDVAKFPELSFEVKELRNAQTAGDVTIAEAVGNFNAHGVSKEMAVPVKLTYLKDKLSQRMPNQKGDLLVLRAEFVIKRSEFGINPGAPQDKVADDIHLKLSIAGAAPK